MRFTTGMQRTWFSFGIILQILPEEWWCSASWWYFPTRLRFLVIDVVVTLTFSWPHFHVFFSCGLAGLSFSPTTLDLLSHRRRFSLSDEKDPSSYFVDLFLSNRNGPIEFSYVAQGRWEMLGVRVETVWKKCAWGLKMGCALHHRIETPENGARVLFLLHHHRPRPNSYNTRRRIHSLSDKNPVQKFLKNFFTEKFAC